MRIPLSAGHFHKRYEQYSIVEKCEYECRRAQKKNMTTKYLIRIACIWVGILLLLLFAGNFSYVVYTFISHRSTIVDQHLYRFHFFMCPLAIVCNVSAHRFWCWLLIIIIIVAGSYERWCKRMMCYGPIRSDAIWKKKKKWVAKHKNCAHGKHNRRRNILILGNFLIDVSKCK